MMLSEKTALVTLVALLAGFESCTEALPVYHEPQQVLSGVLKSWYNFTFNQNSLYIRVVIVNRFDETLEGKGPVSVAVEVASARESRYQKTFNFGASDIVHGGYNSTTRILRVDPGDSVVFAAAWNWIDDAGNDLRFQMFQYAPDLSCPGRGIARNETFLLSGSFSLYDKTGVTALAPISVSLCHVEFYDRGCTDVDASNSCSFRSGGQ
jgi:hypothetical protein